MRVITVVRQRTKHLSRWLIYCLALLSMVSAAWAAPTVTNFYPNDGGINLPVDTTVSATFSETMAPATITSDTFTLSRFLGVKAISAGQLHSVALKKDGTVVAWGDNSGNQRDVPVGLSGVAAIAAGGYHTLALKNDGSVVGWGYNIFGAATPPVGLSGVTAVAGGYYHSLALKNDGTVTAWGYDRYGQATVPAELTGVTAISGGWTHSLALKNNGTVVAWGDDTWGQSTVPSELSGVTAISAGGVHNVVLKADGTVTAWGYCEDGQCDVPVGLSGVTAVSAGLYHTVALKSDGTVVAWGYNDDGECDVPAGLSGVIAVAAGGYHTMALKSDGSVVAWGYNGDGATTIPPSLSVDDSVVAGTVMYDEGTKTATFTPSAPLELGATYNATVNTGAQSAANVPLASNFRWSFTTKLPDPLLSLATVGTGTGSISYSGGSCPGACGPTFPTGTEVTLTPAASPDSFFAGWAGACSGTGACVVTMTGAQNVIATFTLADYVPPDTYITGHPPEVTTSTSTTFTFTASESGCTFQCRLDNGNWEACTSPIAYTGLAQGSHSFNVRATDQGLPTPNTDPTPAAFIWTVDSVPPVVTPSSPAGTYSGPLTISLSTNEPAAIYYTIDGSVPTTGSPFYSAPIAITTSTRLRCLAMDTVGNTSTMDALYLITGSVTHTLTVTKLGTNGGSIDSSPAGISLTSGTAIATFDSVVPVTLAATSTAGSIFSGWGGVCYNMGECTFTMAGDATVTATFVATAQTAYDGAPEGPPAIMNVQSPVSLGTLDMGRNVPLTLTGVFDLVSVKNGVLRAERLTFHSTGS